MQVQKTLVYHNTSAGKSKGETPMKEGLDVWWDAEIPSQPAECEVEWMHSEDPLFLLYTSGSTGKPKGVLHSTGESSDKTTGVVKTMFHFG